MTTLVAHYGSGKTEACTVFSDLVHPFDLRYGARRILELGLPDRASALFGLSQASTGQAQQEPAECAVRLRDLEDDALRGQRERPRKIYKLYAQLVREIAKVLGARVREGIDMPEIKRRFPTLGSAAERLIQKYIFEECNMTPAAIAKDLIRAYATDLSEKTIDRYTRKRLR